MGTSFGFSMSFPVREGVTLEQIESTDWPTWLNGEGSIDGGRFVISYFNQMSYSTVSDLEDAIREAFVRCGAPGAVAEGAKWGDDYEDGPEQWLMGPKHAVLDLRIQHLQRERRELEHDIHMLAEEKRGADEPFFEIG